MRVYVHACAALVYVGETAELKFIHISSESSLHLLITAVEELSTYVNLSDPLSRVPRAGDSINTVDTLRN